jgi:hypothetical protein
MHDFGRFGTGIVQVVWHKNCLEPIPTNKRSKTRTLDY